MPGLFRRRQDSDEIDVPASVDAVVKSLESNKRAVTRWFFKGLLAFNLLLWSMALAISFVLRFR